MKRIIRLNEKKLQRLVESFIENLDMDFGNRDKPLKARYLGRKDNTNGGQLNMRFMGDDEPRKELEELITTAFNEIDIKSLQGYSQKGKYFSVSFKIDPVGGHYMGELSIHDILDLRNERYNFRRKTIIYIDLTSYKIARHNEVRDTQVYDWAIEILNNLGYNFG